MESQELYNKYSDGRHWDAHPTIYAEMFSEFLKSQGVQGTVLDVGCGSGRDVNVFAKKGFDAIGIDYDIREIKRAKERFPSLDVRLGNVEQLDFSDTSIDAVYMINVIHYVDGEKSLGEAVRVLMQGGFFFVHFNLSIVDDEGSIDYTPNSKGVLELLSTTNIVHKRVFERVDIIPVKHTHKILELIVQKE